MTKLSARSIFALTVLCVARLVAAGASPGLRSRTTPRGCRCSASGEYRLSCLCYGPLVYVSKIRGNSPLS